ncbi:MAG TPA: hypothetical protein VMF69_08280 [Gemmataceae bacterium]|nr:hypothetical protein [Gemmataceae bacterium]
MKRFLFRALPASAVVLLTGWLLAAEPTKPIRSEAPKPARSASDGSKSPPLALRAGEDDAQEFVFLSEARPMLVRLHVRVDGKPFTAAWDDFMKYLFAYLDANGDGVLNKQEAERMPNPEQLSFGGISIFGGSVKAPMDKIDTNNDGKVTLDELKAYCRSKNFTPFQFDLNLNPPDPLAQVGIFGGYRPEPEIAVVNKAIFALLDSNKDGRLTKDELAAAQAVLLGRDENEDEIITTQELVPDAKPAGGMMAAISVRVGIGNAASDGKQVLSSIPVRGQAPPDLARLMQDRYDPRSTPKEKAAPKATPKPSAKTMAAPKAEPKPAPKKETAPKVKSDPENAKTKEKKNEPERKLTRKQLGLDEATFARLDADKDGKLDSKEQAAFVQREPDLCLIVSFGDRAGIPLDIAAVAGRPAPLADLVQQQQDNLALLDLGKTRMELRQHEEEHKTNFFTDILRSQLAELFKAADKDGNGYVDEKEAKASPQFRGIFQTVDRDGDGKVNQKEMLAYFDKMQEIQKRARAACFTLALRDQSRGLFELLDTNRDGKLGLRELRQAPKLLERVSAQGKGYLTKDDIPRSYLLTVRRGPQQADGLGAQEAVFDRLYGFSGYEEEAAARGPAWFRKMDRNRDGDVSPKEFLFSDALFRKIDRDGDGLISLEEAEKAGD